jgi:hypothetical protein
MIPSRALIALAAILLGSGAAHSEESWRSLFNGTDLGGWRANAEPASWTVVDGAIRANATKASSHLFWVGGVEPFERFKDFELEVVTRSEPDSNSGIYIHTDMAAQPGSLWLLNGYEIQLNSTAREQRKTGSLYAVVDLATSPVDETAWFTVLVTVIDKRITVKVNGQQTVDYTEPENVQRPSERAGRRLNPLGGAIALQAHDPKSVFLFKSIRIRPLP